MPLIYPTNTQVSLDFIKEGNTLSAKVNFKFMPFELTDYQWNYDSGSATYNMLSSILYNYIPFALCVSPGKYNSYNDKAANFSEITGKWDFNHFTHTYNCRNDLSKLFISDLKSYASVLCKPYDESWFINNPLGKRMNFSFALNSNKYMFLGPEITISNINAILYGICGHAAHIMEQTQMWYEPEIIVKNTLNDVTINAEIDLSEYSGDVTFVLLAADPYSNTIYEKYITIVEETPQTVEYVCEYVQDSLTAYDSENRITASVNSFETDSLTISVSNASDMNWVSSQPVITFKIRKKVSIE